MRGRDAAEAESAHWNDPRLSREGLRTGYPVPAPAPAPGAQGARQAALRGPLAAELAEAERTWTPEEISLFQTLSQPVSCPQGLIVGTEPSAGGPGRWQGRRAEAGFGGSAQPRSLLALRGHLPLRFLHHAVGG